MMKKYFILLFLALSLPVFAQATDLFFSEYVEGSNNNKAMEIYNGTGAAVNLSGYLIVQSSNGNGWAFYHQFPDGATIANNDVWVIITDQTDAAIFPHANADQVLAFPSVVHFNGDDARGLLKIVGSDSILIDVIGIPDADPGTAWEVAGVANGTAEHTLIRKPAVTAGNTNWSAAAGTDAGSSEWIVKDQNDFTNLGMHDMIVPVELTSFTAVVEKGGAALKWTTATELNNRGFQIERKAANEQWKKVAFIDGKGNSTQNVNYKYSDKQVTAGKYSYRLKQIDFDGTFAYSETIEVEIAPVSFELAQNYPNPFNPSTTIKFSMPHSGNVTLRVYNLLGQEVKTLINGFREAGVHTVNFNADGFNSGLYLYKLETANFNQVRKMTLVK